MKERLKNIFKGENFKEFSRKVFTKKKVGAVAAVIVLLIGLRIGYSLAFEVKGTVLKVDNNSIVVANFLGTKSVNTGDYPIDNNRIAVGEKIEITKNLSGDVTSIKVGGGRRGGDNRPGGQPGRGLQRQVQDGKGRPSGIPGQGAPDGTSSASLNQGADNRQNSGGGKQ